MGRARGGLSSKIHALVDAEGRPVTLRLTAGQVHDSADLLGKRIVLIDGPHLARLMIRFEVGCRVEEVLTIKKIDEAFFEG